MSGNTFNECPFLMFLEQTNAPFLRLLIFSLYGFVSLLVCLLFGLSTGK